MSSGVGGRLHRYRCFEPGVLEPDETEPDVVEMWSHKKDVYSKADLRGKGLLPAHEHVVQFLECDLKPGWTTVVALSRTFSHFHVAK